MMRCTGLFVLFDCLYSTSTMIWKHRAQLCQRTRTRVNRYLARGDVTQKKDPNHFYRHPNDRKITCFHRQKSIPLSECVGVYLYCVYLCLHVNGLLNEIYFSVMRFHSQRGHKPAIWRMLIICSLRAAIARMRNVIMPAGCHKRPSKYKRPHTYTN